MLQFIGRVATLSVGYYIYRNLLFHTKIHNNTMLDRQQGQELRSRNFTMYRSSVLHGHFLNTAPNRSRKQVRVAVIGAGSTGVAISKALLDDGYEVLLIDRGDEQSIGVRMVRPHYLSLRDLFRGIVSGLPISVSANILLDQYFTLWLLNSMLGETALPTGDSGSNLSVLAACRRSETFHELRRCDVHKFVIYDQAIKGLHTSEGYNTSDIVSVINADSVVIATGSSAKDLIGLLGYRLPTICGTYYHITAKPSDMATAIAKFDDGVAYEQAGRLRLFTPMVVESTRFQADPLVAVQPYLDRLGEREFNVSTHQHLLIPDGKPIVDRVMGYPNIFMAVGASDGGEAANQLMQLLEEPNSTNPYALNRFMLM